MPPVDLAAEAVAMLHAGAWVLGGAALLAGCIAAGLRAGGERLLPRWTPAHAGWHGVDAVVVFAASTGGAGFTLLWLRQLTGRPAADFALVAPLLAVPTALAAAWGLRVGLRGVPWRPGTVADAARSVLFGCVGVVAAAPVVYAVHFAATAVMQEGFGRTPVDHPLAKGPADAVGGVALYLAVLCVCAPVSEELLCRGVLLKWASARAQNGFAVLLAAGCLGAYFGGHDAPAAAGLAVVAGVLWFGAHAARRHRPRFPSRTVGGIVSTAALFAALHSPVWPTPVPLFVLGLALGTVAARTNGIVAPAVLHGLFNLVAVVRILAG